jgi:5'-AMP-activated protein kinase catalytic alpha subunit
MLPFEAQEFMVTEQKETKPVIMNAFELISLSHGLNLSSLFETPQVCHIGGRSLPQD